MSHYYNTQGELVSSGTPGAMVSPTTILSIRKNEQLQSWRDRVGAEEADRKSKVSTDKGTAVHGWIEAFLNMDAIPTQSADMVPYVQGFLAWHGKYQPKTIEIEAFVYSDLHEFAGRVDYICEIDGELWIIDWKTSAKIHESMELQLAAYRQAYYEMTGKWAKTKIVQLTDQIKRGYREKEMDGDFGVFMAHKTVYDYAVSIGEIVQGSAPTEGLLTV